MPTNLSEAILLAEKIQLLMEALGEHVFRLLIESKKAEWEDYRSHVTDYEIRRYLPIL